jgi:F-type H+-transporting ATPase subunit c
MEEVLIVAETYKFIGAGLATLGAIGAAIGVGMIFAAGINGIARNPGAEGKIRPLVMLGMALAEGLGIISLVIGLYLAFAA